ncbi:hypothetical protein JCGZ_03796 [Jatropha curcas]|uniref:Uncharacterized protein n=1 Tax=Jatropha curcas TaxID=180498 RepID=A0A067L917_JATCU|nr:hypothetical protein JCGZ_03796 [Jatropha curcas]
MGIRTLRSGKRGATAPFNASPASVSEKAIATAFHVASTSVRQIRLKSSATVTGDIGFKPPGLKWKGKNAVISRQLQQ